MPHGLTNSDRMQVLDESHQSDESRKTKCVRYTLRLRDNHAPNAPDEVLNLIDRGTYFGRATISRPGTYFLSATVALYALYIVVFYVFAETLVGGFAFSKPTSAAAVQVRSLTPNLFAFYARPLLIFIVLTIPIVIWIKPLIPKAVTSTQSRFACRCALREPGYS